MIIDIAYRSASSLSLQYLNTIYTRMAALSSDRSSSLLHPAGDLKLSALRRALGEHGISAEFSGGMLVCQSHILVKTGGSDGRILLEGPLCPDYYRIRDIVYLQYHVC